ncbi:hypothetical protein [Curtobacterium sp. RRHDQ10]|uniref:hypothetical protein n=1 Tax=Curtobacterium phyllosphaerae TaxID=3413379 RepID=UPI003BF39A39
MTSGPRLDAAFLGDHLGEAFTLVPLGVDAAPIEAVLTRCDPTVSGFRAELLAPTALGQATYGIRGHGLDDVVFLVAVARSDEGTVLEAVFNHIEGELR